MQELLVTLAGKTPDQFAARHHVVFAAERGDFFDPVDPHVGPVRQPQRFGRCRLQGEAVGAVNAGFVQARAHFDDALIGVLRPVGVEGFWKPELTMQPDGVFQQLLILGQNAEVCVADVP